MGRTFLSVPGRVPRFPLTSFESLKEAPARRGLGSAKARQTMRRGCRDVGQGPMISTLPQGFFQPLNVTVSFDGCAGYWPGEDVWGSGSDLDSRHVVPPADNGVGRTLRTSARIVARIPSGAQGSRP